MRANSSLSRTIAEDVVPEEEGAAEFRLDLSWPAAWANGTLVQRTKTIR